MQYLAVKFKPTKFIWKNFNEYPNAVYMNQTIKYDKEQKKLYLWNDLFRIIIIITNWMKEWKSKWLRDRLVAIWLTDGRRQAHSIGDTMIINCISCNGSEECHGAYNSASILHSNTNTLHYNLQCSAMYNCNVFVCLAYAYTHTLMSCQ